jgi:hypothetical protein
MSCHVPELSSTPMTQLDGYNDRNTVTRGFEVFADRYKWDFRLCTPDKGWAQLDTRQDAWYFGNWINPITRQLMSYCEGDTTFTECQDDADFAATVRECCDWHKERGYFIGIDCMMMPEIEQAFDRVGLGEYLHGTITRKEYSVEPNRNHP